MKKWGAKVAIAFAIVGFGMTAEMTHAMISVDRAAEGCEWTEQGHEGLPTVNVQIGWNPNHFTTRQIGARWDWQCGK